MNLNPDLRRKILRFIGDVMERRPDWKTQFYVDKDDIPPDIPVITVEADKFTYGDIDLLFHLALTAFGDEGFKFYVIGDVVGECPKVVAVIAVSVLGVGSDE